MKLWEIELKHRGTSEIFGSTVEALGSTVEALESTFEALGHILDLRSAVEALRHI